MKELNNLHMLQVWPQKSSSGVCQTRLKNNILPLLEVDFHNNPFSHTLVMIKTL